MALALLFNALHFWLEVAIEPKQGTAAFWLNTTVENLQSECWQVALAGGCSSTSGGPARRTRTRTPAIPAEALVVPVAVVALSIVLTALVAR